MPQRNTKEFAGKKVLIIVENLPLPFDRRVWQEATALRDNGAQVTIICPKGKGYEKSAETIDDIVIYRHPLPWEGDSAIGYLLEYGSSLLFEFILTLRCLFTRGFDVIHACNPPDLIYLVVLPFKLIGKRFVFDHHDINPELYEAKFNRRDWMYRVLRYFERQTFRYADISIATNESYKKIAVERGGRKPEDVFVVRSGPCLERLKFVPPDTGIRNGRRYLVGYVGVIGKQEGLQYLVDACVHIVKHRKRQDIQFVCVGGGTELAAIREYARQRGVADYFTFTGRVSDAELLKALNSSDVCVNPDEYNEMNDKSTMNKIMEYMALGKPIVQFDLKEGRFSARQASLYARPNDAEDMAEKIIELLGDPEKRKKMGSFGYERVRKELAWNHEKARLFEAYRALFLQDRSANALRVHDPG